MHRAGIRKPLLMTAGRAVQSLPVSPHIQKLKSKAEYCCDPSAWKHSPEPVSTLWRKACPRGGIQYEGGHSKVTCLAGAAAWWQSPCLAHTRPCVLIPREVMCHLKVRMCLVHLCWQRNTEGFLLSGGTHRSLANVACRWHTFLPETGMTGHTETSQWGLSALGLGAWLGC